MTGIHRPDDQYIYYYLPADLWHLTSVQAFPIYLAGGFDDVWRIQDFARALQQNAIQGFDVVHQLWRLRNTKSMSEAEVELIMRTMAENVQTYDQVVEVRAAATPLPA